MINFSDYSICAGHIYNINFKKRKLFINHKGEHILITELSFDVRDIPFAISRVHVKSQKPLLKDFCRFSEIDIAKIKEADLKLSFNLVYNKNNLFALINTINKEYFLISNPEDYQDFIKDIKKKNNTGKLSNEDILIYNVIANIENVDEKYEEEINYAKNFLLHTKLDNGLIKKVIQPKKTKI